VEPSDKLLSKIIDLLDQQGKLICYCAGFELGKWRLEPLSRHLIAWLPAAILRPHEVPPHVGDWFQSARAAAMRFFKDVDPTKRGEIGELLLHIICRQEFDTFPTLGKLFYKSATNDTVKGFDLVHSRYFEAQDKLELWLGEAKFYSDGKQAVYAAVASINEHLKSGFLQQEKALIGPLLRKDTPGYNKLKWIFNDNTSLDELVDRIVIPTLVTFDSKHAKRYPGDLAIYRTAVEAEIRDELSPETSSKNG
jgi:hypothetical protein